MGNLAKILLRVFFLSCGAVCLTFFLVPQVTMSDQEQSYEELLQELNYKRNRINKLKSNKSSVANYFSLGVVNSGNQINAKGGLGRLAWLQGVDVGYIKELGPEGFEGRSHLRLFYNQQEADMRVGLQELSFQLARLNGLRSLRWHWLWGGGVSFRSLQVTSPQSHFNELSIQLNGILGVETQLSTASRLGLELGTRFPFGVSGNDQFSLDAAIKLKTEIE
ncbi:MAG: hypothetical protein NZ480_06600 [Bdellovibrionaceae bacterium]|nr:hypothetical protein [Pseudobdellovibrionaceae bacterium]MDW8190407.1 hypothetical protein [Pseudobdellovibrionaceae bacterium]